MSMNLSILQFVVWRRTISNILNNTTWEQVGLNTFSYFGFKISLEEEKGII
jgi:hypothetical protein